MWEKTCQIPDGMANHAGFIFYINKFILSAFLIILRNLYLTWSRNDISLKVGSKTTVTFCHFEQVSNSQYDQMAFIGSNQLSTNYNQNIIWS